VIKVLLIRFITRVILDTLASCSEPTCMALVTIDKTISKWDKLLQRHANLKWVTY
jgi:hypothetical protein